MRCPLTSFAVAAGVTSELGDFGRALEHARLEGFGDSPLVTGDILGEGLFARGLGNDGTGVDLGILGDDDVGAGGDGVGGKAVLAVGGAADENLRVDFFAVFKDDDVFHAGGFVDFFADGDADDEVAQVDLAAPSSIRHGQTPETARCIKRYADEKERLITNAG